MDEFWEIQLDQSGFYGSLGSGNDDSDNSCVEQTSDSREFRLATNARAYSFLWGVDSHDGASCCSVDLRLSSLPMWTGSFSPLGADPWYGSALLASLLLHSGRSFGNNTVPNSRLQDHIARGCTRQHPMRVLELGSGAVGISAFAAALSILQGRSSWNHSKDGIIDEVVLTDNNLEVLQQLKYNTDVAARAFDEMACSSSLSAHVPNMRVQKLDWSDDFHEIDLAPFQLAIGAELVYTPSTARACFKVVQKLLRCNSDILIVVVQVSDREGWRDTFLSRLESIGALVVTEQLPVEIHDHAAKFVEQGGTLNALRDFEVCYISPNQSIRHASSFAK